MEEKILEILAANNEDILDYTGDNMLEDGIVDSFEIIAIVGDLEEEFDIEIDAAYVVEEYFGNKDAIIKLMKMLLG
ncbi:MAG: acyl carrier protein [Lachnospiraceae bacterium]|nr:acyl carrier protein [Lachnospiraceae bacterium]